MPELTPVQQALNAVAMLRTEDLRAVHSWISAEAKRRRTLENVLKIGTIVPGQTYVTSGLSGGNNGLRVKVIRVRSTKVEVDVPGRGVCVIPASCLVAA